MKNYEQLWFIYISTYHKYQCFSFLDFIFGSVSLTPGSCALLADVMGSAWRYSQPPGNGVPLRRTIGSLTAVEIALSKSQTMAYNARPVRG